MADAHGFYPSLCMHASYAHTASSFIHSLLAIWKYHHIFSIFTKNDQRIGLTKRCCRPAAQLPTVHSVCVLCTVAVEAALGALSLDSRITSRGVWMAAKRRDAAAAAHAHGAAPGGGKPSSVFRGDPSSHDGGGGSSSTEENQSFDGYIDSGKVKATTSTIVIVMPVPLLAKMGHSCLIYKERNDNCPIRFLILTNQKALYAYTFSFTFKPYTSFAKTNLKQNRDG